MSTASTMINYHIIPQEICQMWNLNLLGMFKEQCNNAKNCWILWQFNCKHYTLKRNKSFFLDSEQFLYKELKCSCQNIMWWSSCSGNTHKTNLRQFFLQCCRFYDSNLNGTGLQQGDLLEKFRENNLAKLRFWKLLRKISSYVFIKLQFNDFQKNFFS